MGQPFARGRREPLALFGIVILYFSCCVTAMAQSIGCGHTFYLGCYEQSWNCMSQYPCLQELRGKVLKIKYNTGTTNDDDLNVFIVPDGEYSDLAKNRDGQVVGPLDGLPIGTMETELRAPLSDFPSLTVWDELFPKYTRVMAQGWWVEDTAHGNKTELHPLRYMYGPVDEHGRIGNSFSLFVAQDTSGRFDITGDPVTFALTIPVSTELDTVRPDKENRGGTASAGVVHERRREFWDITCNNQIGYGSLYLGLSTTAESGVQSVYLGQFDVGKEQIFSDEIEYSVAIGGSGTRRVQIRTKPRFTDPYLTVHPTFEMKSDSGKAVAPSSGIFTLVYAPTEDIRDHIWRLFATEELYYRGFPIDPTRKAYAQKAREYRIEPSNIVLTPNYSGAPAPTVDLPVCLSPGGVTATEAILPLVNTVPGSFSWWIRVDAPQRTVPITESLASGKVATLQAAQIAAAEHSVIPAGQLQQQGWEKLSGMAWTKVTKDIPFKYQNFTASLDPTNDHVMRFDYGNGALFPVSVRATAQTDLGEAMETIAQTGVRCTAGTNTVEEFIESMLKATAALERLTQLGLLSPKLPPDNPAAWEALFSHGSGWKSILLRLGIMRLGKVDLRIGEPYEVARHLPGGYGTLATKFFDWLDGRGTLSQGDMRRLQIVATATNRIAWSSPPDPGALKKAAEAGLFQYIQAPVDRRTGKDSGDK